MRDLSVISAYVFFPLLTCEFPFPPVALNLDPSTGRPTVGQNMTYRNPANKVVAILWHQGEAVRCSLLVFFFSLTLY